MQGDNLSCSTSRFLPVTINHTSATDDDVTRPRDSDDPVPLTIVHPSDHQLSTHLAPVIVDVDTCSYTPGVVWGAATLINSVVDPQRARVFAVSSPLLS